MYSPQHFAENDTAELHALIRACPLASVIVAEGDLPTVDHLPLLLTPRAHGDCLRGHVARANPLWQKLASGRPVVALFHGPQGYVSPGLYPSKQVDGRVVPTWNYAVVHVHGTARAVDDLAWVEQLVRELTVEHERTRPAPWAVDDAPEDFIGQQLKAIVGIEIGIERIAGKFKLSQNRCAADREAVARAALDGTDTATAALGQLMRTRAQS